VADERPTVPVVVPRLPIPVLGGAEKRTLRLLEALERAGGRPHLVSSEPATGGADELVRERGWSCTTVAARWEPDVRARLGQHVRRWPAPRIPEVAETVERLALHAPFVQLEHTQSAGYGSALGRRPSVLSTHNVDSEMVRTIGAPGGVSRARLRAAWRWRAMRAAERRAARAHDIVFCVSEADAGYFGDLGARAVVVPNGVDDDLWTVPSLLEAGHQEAMLFFGNLAYPPNAAGVLRFLEEGWPALRETRPLARLRIAGGGAPPDLHQAAQRAPGVQLLGFADDLLAELARCRLVLVPLWQGAGTRLKVLEAMAAARPVVGTALGVERVGFIDGIHGLVADGCGGLASAAATLLADPVRGAAMGATARDHAESVRWVRATRLAECAYARLLDLPRGRSATPARRGPPRIEP
jgi:glycosyltransferase involved in cell wall biosynthesis